MIDKVKIKITGKNPSTFIKKLMIQNIDIYELEQNDDSLKVKIKYSDYKEIIKTKSIYKIEIINYYGLIKIKKICKAYFLFIIIFILGIIINYFLSNLIWKVEIINSNQKLVSTIRKDLKKLKVAPIHKKISYKEKEKVKKQILTKEKDLIEWIEIEEKGSKYIIKVEERKKNSKEKKCPERNIVSKKNAILLEIEAENGEVVKKKNDYLSKGETVISGLIHNKETIVSKKCAIGKIYGEVWYKVVVIVPRKKEIIHKTNNKSKGITLTIFNNSYNFNKKFRTYEKNEYNIIEENIFPIKLSFINYYQTKVEKILYTNQEIENIAIKTATKKIKQKLPKEKIISKKVLKKTTINSKIKVEVFFKIKENITDYEDISNLDIEEMNKKEE